MVEFKIVRHTGRHANIVEIWVDGVFRAALYPQEPNTVRLISAHLTGDPVKEHGYPPGWVFVFDSSEVVTGL